MRRLRRSRRLHADHLTSVVVADRWIAIDLSQDPGEQFSPEVIAEIREVAPSAVVNGSITTAKLADDAVTQDKIAAGAVGATEIATGAVGATALASGGVTTAKINDAAVTPAKVGTGVVTAVDSSDATVATKIKYVTAVQYAAIGSPDPNTLYFIS